MNLRSPKIIIIITIIKIKKVIAIDIFTNHRSRLGGSRDLQAATRGQGYGVVFLSSMF